MTEEVLRKLTEAFANAFTDKEACLYAGISPSTLYKYAAENPDFSERKELLKLSLNMHAKNNISKSIKSGDVGRSIWWAMNKMADEFAPKSKIQHSGSIQTPVPAVQVSSAVADALRLEYEARLRSSIVSAGKTRENGQNASNSPIVVDVGAGTFKASGPLSLAN